MHKNYYFLAIYFYCPTKCSCSRGDGPGLSVNSTNRSKMGPIRLNVTLYTVKPRYNIPYLQCSKVKAQNLPNAFSVLINLP